MVPINLDILQKEIEVPKLLAKLSYLDTKQAIEFLQLWGEKRISITEIHEKLSTAVKESA